MATKYNNYAFKMRQKYGNEWDSPLFHSGKTTAESELPSQAPPLFIDDATEEKALVYDLIRPSVEQQRKEILSIIKSLGQCTDNDIARTYNRAPSRANNEALRIHPSTVSARRNELRDLGLVVPVLDEFGKKKKKVDPVTKTPNTIWRTTQ